MSIMRAQLPRELQANGGITQIRQPYFLGKIVRAVTKPIKKIVKSPVGKAALLAGLGSWGLGVGPLGGANVPGAGWLKSDFMKRMLLKAPKEGKPLLDWAPKNLSPYKVAALAATAAPFAAPKIDETESLSEEVTDVGKFDFDYGKMISELQDAIQTGEQELVDNVLAKYNLSRADMPPLSSLQQTAAEGGRIGMQEGGIMDLGGMEKDYRNTGGFVEIGGKEKADDVPARLSKNEFVFTADAVRSAGGGDIDKGAEIMENVMKNLEAGGKISEESQGMRGAQEMFDVSERLSEVI